MPGAGGAFDPHIYIYGIGVPRGVPDEFKRFVNYTRDAIMFGPHCCTFIPNNTSLDGSITKVLEGLTSLPEELAENSGVDDPFTHMMESWFGRWSTFFSSLLISLAVAVAVLITCGCCCIPCIRGLITRLIDTALTRTMLMRTMTG